MKTLPLSQTSQNELGELRELMSHIAQKLHDFRHVEGFVPKPLAKSVTDFTGKLGAEFEKRENEK